MNIGHPKEMQAKLRECWKYNPHDCDVPDCPGRRNERKLELFEEMLDCLVTLRSASESRLLSPKHRAWELANSIIARAKGEK